MTKKNNITKIYKQSILCLFIILLVACSESKPVDTTGITQIYPLENPNTYYSDTLTIYGQFLGKADTTSYLVFNDTLKISSLDCLHWTESKISVIVPKLPKSSTLYVVVNEAKINITKETYYIELNVEPLPEIQTVIVKSGTFEMGGTFGFQDELPVHNVTISKDLLVMATEVNQRIYNLVISEEDNPSLIKSNELPVYNISWIDAVKFCNEISKLLSLQPPYEITQDNYVLWDTTANGWRLPTEAEWEFFAQIDTNNFDLKENAWFATNSGLRPQECARLKPNIAGLYDCLGNVNEWCWDLYDANYYSVSPLVNPKGAKTGTNRVMRGGCCNDGKAFVRIQKRSTTEPMPFVGMRLVRNE